MATGTFAVDGAEHQAEHGAAAAWKHVDAREWEVLWRLGDVAHRDRLALSADDGTPTVRGSATQPQRASERTTFTFTRTAGGNGLDGSWRLSRVETSTPDVYEIRPDGPNGIIIQMSQAICHAQLDGKDYPLSGPTQPPGATLALRQIGPRTLEVTQKQRGTATATIAYEVSPDGATLIALTRYPENLSSPVRQVFDRQ